MTSYLLFSLNGARYGVDAVSVREIIWLPELTVVDEAPLYIAGVINIRGKIVPVMNLDLRFGHPHRPYQLSDHAVMLQADGVDIGVIVSDVSNVVDIADGDIEPSPRYDGEAPTHTQFLAGNAKVGEEIVMLLDVPRLIHGPALPVADVAANMDAYFCPDATAEERGVFHVRAHNLMQLLESVEADEQIPLSIIQLDQEYFGVELDVVLEFCRLRRVTPIPCCPPHIAGNMNLRGDVLTLADIRALLNISTEGTATEVMVVESGDFHMGVPVDKVLEVIYLRPGDIAPLSAAPYEEKHEYCKGVARYGEGSVSILDIQKILSQGDLEVGQEV